jgi:hypothetical protein
VTTGFYGQLMDVSRKALIKRQWHAPAITIEMPFRQTRAITGCTTDAAVAGAPAGATYTPVVKAGGAADLSYPGCAGTS